MLENLKENLKNSYAPYSNFHVSSIVVMKDSKAFTGVNIENASFGATICAERVAITKAISKGYKKGDFKEIHIINDSGKKGMPCFICRQVFTEFFDKDTKIFVYDIEGDKDEYTLKDICPYPFDEEDLKWKVDL